MPQQPLYSDNVKMAGTEVAKRGFAYFQERRVHLIQKDAESSIALVEGSEIYCVHLRFDENKQLLSYSCSCPYGAFCKHIVATLYEMDRQKEDIPFTDPNDILRLALRLLAHEEDKVDVPLLLDLPLERVVDPKNRHTLVCAFLEAMVSDYDATQFIEDFQKKMGLSDEDVLSLFPEFVNEHTGKATDSFVKYLLTRKNTVAFQEAFLKAKGRFSYLSLKFPLEKATEELLLSMMKATGDNMPFLDEAIRRKDKKLIETILSRMKKVEDLRLRLPFLKAIFDKEELSALFSKCLGKIRPGDFLFLRPYLREEDVRIQDLKAIIDGEDMERLMRGEKTKASISQLSAENLVMVYPYVSNKTIQEKIQRRVEVRMTQAIKKNQSIADDLPVLVEYAAKYRFPFLLELLECVEMQDKMAQSDELKACVYRAYHILGLDDKAGLKKIKEEKDADTEKVSLC